MSNLIKKVIFGIFTRVDVIFMGYSILQAILQNAVRFFNSCTAKMKDVTRWAKNRKKCDIFKKNKNPLNDFLATLAMFSDDFWHFSVRKKIQRVVFRDFLLFS